MNGLRILTGLLRGTSSLTLSIEGSGMGLGKGKSALTTYVCQNHTNHFIFISHLR